MFLWRKIAAAWARRGWDGEPQAEGKKKGSIRRGVLPYVGEGRRLLPLDCCAWFWRHIVADAVHGWNLCKDSVCDFHKDWPVNLLD